MYSGTSATSISVYKGNSIQTQQVLYYLYLMKEAQLTSETLYIFNKNLTMDNIKHSTRTAIYWWIMNWKDVKEHCRGCKLYASALDTWSSNDSRTQTHGLPFPDNIYIYIYIYIYI